MPRTHPQHFKAKQWAGRLLLIALGIATPEVLAWVIFPQRGLTFAESIARDQHLPTRKAPGTKRVFIFGASSVVGYHHLDRSSLYQAIEFLLHRSAPETSWTVVNFGKPGEGSQFDFDAARDSLRYHPDLILIYAGESEFAPIPVLRRQARYQWERWALKSKAFRVARDLTGSSSWPSVPDFRRHQWNEVTQAVTQDQRQITRSFEARGKHLCRSKPAETGVVYLQPVLGLDTGPSYYDELDKWDLDFNLPATRAYVRGLLNQEAGRYREAVQNFQEALTYDSSLAAVQQRLGVCLMALGHKEAGEAAMIRADELDPYPRHVPASAYSNMINASAHCHFIPLPERVARQHGTRLVPADWIEDGCHATVPLEYEEAQIILDDPYVQNQLGLKSVTRDIPYDQYRREKKLDSAYFAQVDLRLVRYFQGAPAGDFFLQRAKTLHPDNPDWPAVAKQHARASAAWHTRRKKVLDFWRSELNRRTAS